MSIDTLRKPLRDHRENSHCFSVAFLALQTPAIGIKLNRSRDFERTIPSSFCFVRSVEGFENVRFGAEVIESFFVLNRGISPTQCLVEIDLSGQTKSRAFIQSLPRKLAAAL